MRTSQKRTVVSPDPLAKCLPSGLNLTDITASAWPGRELRNQSQGYRSELWCFRLIFSFFKNTEGNHDTGSDKGGPNFTLVAYLDCLTTFFTCFHSHFNIVAFALLYLFYLSSSIKSKNKKRDQLYVLLTFGPNNYLYF